MYIKKDYVMRTRMRPRVFSPEPVVIVAIWRINREVVHGQSGVRGEEAPMLHVFSSYRRRTC